MTFIEVEAIMIEAHGDGTEHREYGGETGTAEFYEVEFTLQLHLGENIIFYHHPNNDTFIIGDEYEEEDSDNGIDNSYDYIKIINDIYDNSKTYLGSRYLRFEIRNIQ
jgi:hypothetical protein